MEFLQGGHSARAYGVVEGSLRFHLPAFGRNLENFARVHSSTTMDKILLWLCNVVTSTLSVRV
jgi:hypothetical protein